MKKNLKVFSLTLMMALLLTACGEKPSDEPKPTDKPTQEPTVEPTVEPTEVPTVEPTVEPTPEPEVNEAPTITLDEKFQRIECELGEEINLFEGLSATDKEDGDITDSIIIDDDGGYDMDTVGEYTIKFIVEDSKGATATVEKVIAVIGLKPGFIIRINAVDLKWQNSDLNTLNSGSQMLILEKRYKELDADFQLTDVPQTLMLFKNVSDKEINVSVAGGYGEAAIFNKNGEVIEGRDGANGKLVNAEFPNRVGSGGTIKPAAYAKDMKVPSQGYILLAPFNDNGKFDTDGREFVCNHIISNYGNVLQVVRQDNLDQELTIYKNQAPTVSNLTELSVSQGSKWDEKILLQGLQVKDDNGTFLNTDDIVIKDPKFTIKTPEGFSTDNLASFTFELTIKDDLNAERTVKRVVKIVPSTAPKITIGANSYTPEKYTVNPETFTPSLNDVIIYNNSFKGNLPDAAYSIAVLFKVNKIDENNVEAIIKEVRDGTSGWYISQNGGGLTPAECNANFGAGKSIKLDVRSIFSEVSDEDKGITYKGQTTSELKNDEFIALFPFGYPGNISRAWAFSNLRSLEKSVSLSYMETFPVPEISINGNKFRPDLVEVNPSSYVVGAKNTLKIYTAGQQAPKAPWGFMALIDAKTGKVLETRDYNNRFTLDAEGNIVTTPGTTSSDICNAGKDPSTIPAIGQVAEGQILIIFPNENGNPNDGSRKFGLDNVKPGMILELVAIELK